MAGYVHTPYKKSDNVINKENQANADYSKYKNILNKGYYVGAGGYGEQFNDVNNNIAYLNKNAPSLTFKPTGTKKYNKAKNAIVNREAFSYDMDNDVLFQQAKNQFQALGKTAMIDTIGQASSMTGGYGNSYATTVGAQAYNNYLQQLNNSVGDYYAMALSAYNTESDRLNNAFNTLATDRNNQLNEWQGDQNVWNTRYSTELGRLSEIYGLDQNAWNTQVDGYGKIAGLSADAYQNAYNNEFSAYTTEQNLIAEQRAQALEEAKFAETQKQNAFDRTMAVSNSSTTKKKKKGNENKNKIVASDLTNKFIEEHLILTYNSDGTIPEKDAKLILYDIENSNLSPQEINYLYQFYENVLPEKMKE